MDPEKLGGSFALGSRNTQGTGLKLNSPAAQSERWEPLPLLAEAALDDPQLGLLVFDPELHLLHVTHRVSEMLGTPKGFSPELTDVLQFLRRADFDPDSTALLEVGLLKRPNRDYSEPLNLRKTNGREIQMRVRAIGRQHRLVSFGELPEAQPAAVAPSDEAVFKDPLTDLSTRVHFQKVVTEILSGQLTEPMFVFLLDLDRFKAVNDTLGHAAGDAVLRLTAKRIRSVVRDTDVVSRLGGDEFAVAIRPRPGNAEAESIARRIVDLVGRTYMVDGQLINVGVSIGIAVGPKDSSRYDALLRCADLALYYSKNRGRGNYHFFDPEMETRAQERRTGELDLRRAIALRQLELYYQPQVSIDTGELTGFEALIRWRHPERGLIPPSGFLDLAEEIGVIIPIGEWVLNKACREATKWPASVIVAVNASPLQFETGRFGAVVRKALADSGLLGSRLEIEITEGTLLRNEDTVLNTLHELRAMGVRIAMDDFGVGYASLSQLARFPFDKIKIDKSLSGSGGETPKHRAIVRAISALANDLGIPTTAEGIETPEQLKRIASDGCAAVQGFLFSKPVPSHELEELIAGFFPNAAKQTPDCFPEEKHERQLV